MGVGSVLDEETVRLAVAAGAEFVITPTTKLEVIRACNRFDRPIACGAFTPTEAQAAYEAGADFIKVFPADALGPNYIKAIMAPLPHLKIVPTGGIDAKTCGDFVKAGCVAVAAGSSLVAPKVIKNRDWKKISESAEAMIAAVRAARNI
jgi:2-dehydro-3-deoxyphosphogluconate aldolase/(4S)-4-hydroxy-2-oxoglutarate aldolase